MSDSQDSFGDSDARLTFGLRDARLWHISEVTRGLDCGCVCPHCKCDIVAKHGDVRVPHFAHYCAGECRWGPETAVHLLAKEILQCNSSLVLPEIPSRYQDAPLRAPGRIDHVYVRVEKRFHDIVPDIIVSADNADLIIEVYVTNKVRSEKARKIRSARVAAIEVDVRHLRRVMERITVQREILDEVRHKRWIYSPQADAERAPPPPISVPPPTPVAGGEAGNGPSDKIKTRAESDDPVPASRYEYQRRFSDERRAIIFGHAPARCKCCGQSSRKWKVLDCESGECVCENCRVPSPQ